MRKTLVIHPLLFAMVPILALLTDNMTTRMWQAIVLPMLVVVGFVLLLWMSLVPLTRTYQRAGAIASLQVLLFFSIGGIAPIIYKITGGCYLDSIVLVVWATLAVACSWGIMRIGGNQETLTRLLNAMGVFLLSLSVVRISVYTLRTKAAWPVCPTIETTWLDANNTSTASQFPDIYYIILDGYARSDILKELYQYDNSEFQDYLRQSGFYIAERSHANYSQTPLSLASSLNGEYLDAAIPGTARDSDNRVPLASMISHSRTVRLLRERGYTFVAFSSGYELTQISTADVYIKTGHLGAFVNGLIGTSILGNLQSVRRMQYGWHAQAISRTLEELPKSSTLGSPVFVFAHILAPHPPFVFEKDGESHVPNTKFYFGDASLFTGNSSARRQQYRREYTNQLAYMSTRIQDTIAAILANSRRPPVIILQSDHGPGSTLDWEAPNPTSVRERMAILNAYYLPGDGQKYLSASITPVNTFRVICKHYLGTNLQLLEDKCFFSTWRKPYVFSDVTGETHP